MSMAASILPNFLYKITGFDNVLLTLEMSNAFIWVSQQFPESPWASQVEAQWASASVGTGRSSGMGTESGASFHAYTHRKE